MITLIEPGRTLHVTGETTSHIEDELSAAVVLIRPKAQEDLQGILITRLSADTYTVAIDASVPYGVTDERDAWTLREPCPGPDQAPE